MKGYDSSRSIGALSNADKPSDSIYADNDRVSIGGYESSRPCLLKEAKLRIESLKISSDEIRESADRPNSRQDGSNKIKANANFSKSRMDN